MKVETCSLQNWWDYWNRGTDAGANPQSPRAFLDGSGRDLRGDAARSGAA